MKYVQDEFNWFDRGSLFNASKNADQTEFAAMMEGSVPLERGIRDDIIADEHHADIPDHDYSWQDEEAALDFIAGPLLSEIDRRISLMGEHYPFERVNSSLRYKGSDTLVYEFCLAVSLLKNLSSKPYNRFPLLFELVATEAARCYLGGAALSLRCGWPSHNRLERPTSFKELLALITERTGGEFRWSPSIPLPAKWSSHAPKDEGMDFIAWKPFEDQRLGPLFLLGQCACGDDWENKLNDLDANRLRRWVNPITFVDFVRAFAVPHHIPGHYIFADVASRAGLTFDRVRLTLLAQNNRDIFIGKYRPLIEAVIHHTFPAIYA